ncbi:glucosyl-3-phosphoglycerate synthase [Rubrobacter taiwanensis]|jgi:glucosyl-3-phosphoglycerate synthase|uniref:Glucosyl-3-phosphoglycerate synthase n=1 Tax=Rubrobacter taiwanensis TaxID=185139 RepID=A0A4R1BGN5_9ACTN|nr:glucosyl-3-phosphoglycerate synthase [Rubrobacter taiwanensis]TCJ16396.1 glucosyl-3-phosphoglycerate synthase [Rubrobacter taiwanensis]
MRIHEREYTPVNVAEWFERRSYHHAQFQDVEALARRKREVDVSVSVVLPGRNVADTIGGIIDQIHELNERAPLVDQILVVDADSSDGTSETARKHGAEVYSENELLPQYGPAIGKGDAMWRSLTVARGDLVAYADSDTRDFEPQFVYGILGPILTDPGIRFVKAAYRRPFRKGEEITLDGGGRVTELSTKPLFNLFYPQLTGFVQPLAGEFVAPKELFGSIPFFTGYAVETGMMIDVLRTVGLGAMAQVDLGTRQNRHQPLFELGKMAYSVVRAVARRLHQEGRLGQLVEPHLSESLYQLDSYVHAAASPEGLQLQEHVVDIVERPPLNEVLR